MGEFLRLKKSNCKNCYKCIRHCPVKSIRFSGSQAHIVADACVLCGQCFVVCPQHAKEIVDDTERVRVLLQSEAPVIASLAPSFVANYDGVDMTVMRAALQKLGFADAEETAIGAGMVSREYERLLDEAQGEAMISSCCHSVNLLIQKYYPSALPYLAKVCSPMQAHCRDIKNRNKEAKTVFIGPCVAKKDEGFHDDGDVDAVMTFEELRRWLTENDISLDAQSDSGAGTNETVSEAEAGAFGIGDSRFYPTAGGILKTMKKRRADYTYLSIDGMDNCIAALNEIERGGMQHCFIEMNACVGSCIGGPVMEKHHRAPVGNYLTVAAYAADGMKTTPQAAEKERCKGATPTAMDKRFSYMGQQAAMPSEAQLASILKKMGKTKPQDELNCGSCGYDTCREKAVAIFQGKAEISMCLPFLKEKAENFSDTIVKNSPNGLLVLSEELEVQQINRAACKLMSIHTPSDVLGDRVVRIMEPGDFLQVLSTGRNIYEKMVYLAEYDKYVEESILYDRDYHVLICMMRDMTALEAQRTEQAHLREETVKTADRVVEKQMRIVQEIASLLGETAAETKIALTKLKESIADE